MGLNLWVVVGVILVGSPAQTFCLPDTLRSDFAEIVQRIDQQFITTIRWSVSCMCVDEEIGDNHFSNANQKLNLQGTSWADSGAVKRSIVFICPLGGRVPGNALTGQSTSAWF